MLKKIIGIAAVCIIGGGALVGAGLTMTRVDAGTYKITQSLNGKIDVLDTAGWKYTGFTSNITRYDIGGSYYFSSDELDGGKGRETDPIEVRFKDATTGLVHGHLQFRLPIDKKTRVELHELYGRNYNEVVHNLIRQSVQEAVVRSATYFTAEEVLTAGSSDFARMVNRQLAEGIFAQEKSFKKVKDDENKEATEVIVKIKTDEDGNDIISQESKFKKFGVEIISLNIKKVDPDDNAKNLLEKKKTSEFNRIISKQQMEEAIQIRETAILTAQADLEKAKGVEEINKMRSIKEAEKNKEVAQLLADQELYTAQKNREASEEKTKALLIEKRAEAEANKLLVAAGLSPKEKAEIERDTKVGVAQALATVNVPSIVMAGGDESGDTASKAIGINMLMGILEKLNK